MTTLPAFDDARWLGPDASRSSEMEALWSWLIDQDAGLPNWLDLPPAEARRLHDGQARRWNAVLPEVESVEPLVLPGPVAVSCQLIVPPRPKPGCILFLHGGGWAFGNLETHQRFMRLLARAARRRVLAVDYRLAPTFAYPAPLDDCCAAWAWLRSEADRNPELQGPLTIAGDSAGANLAMGVMLDAVARGAPLPARACLFYGAYDAAADGLSYRRFAEGYGLTSAGMRRFWQFYVPHGADHDDPRVSAVHARDEHLRLLPPLYLNAASLDPLLSDTLAFSKRLTGADVDHELVVHEGVHHGFMQMSLRLTEAQRAIERAGAFLRAD